MSSATQFNKGNHCVFSIYVHLMFVTKYRKKIFDNSIDNASRVSDDVIRLALFLMLNNATDVALNLLMHALERGLDFKQYQEKKTIYET